MADVKQKTGAKPSKRSLDTKKKKRQNDTGEPTKEEYAVAKFVRFKCPTKKGNFGHGMGGEEVVYFVGSKAVDCLMESKWSSASKKGSKKPKDQALFTDRQSAVNYMQQLMMHGLFFRAKKLVPKIKDKSDKSEDGEKKKGDKGKKGTEIKEETPKSPKASKETEVKTSKSPKASKETEVKRRKKDKGDKEDEEKSGKDKKEKEKDEETEKTNEKSPKTRKVRLDWHNDQLFIDGPSIFVWKYDPTPLKTWLLGLGIVLGAAACCLFPLWPMQIRVGVYYVSSTALILISVFFCFVVLRTVIFGLVWALTLGRHHFWLFPNLTEDCSFYDSFKPVYTHTYGSKGTDDKETKKDKKSDSEDEAEGGDAEEEDVRENKEDQPEDRASESENENEEEQEKDGGESVTQDDNDDDEDKSEGTSNGNSTRTSTDEEPQTSQVKKSPKKRRVRRDDGSVNGDFEIVDPPKQD